MKVSSRRWTQRETQKLTIYSIAASLCFFLLMNYITRGATTVTILFTDINDNYMDFFNSLLDATYANPYIERHVIYPPLCYVLYGFFGYMIPPDYYLFGSFYIRSTLEGMFSFGCYLFLSLFALCFFTNQYAKELQVNNHGLIGVLMLSAPVLFAVQRGNFIILTGACLIAFLCYKDDQSRVKQHFGFLMLAIAANIKIYPAVFGLLLISEKRWRDCLFCIVYGITLFCLPMLFFGGLSNIPVLIGNIMGTTGKFSVRLGTRVDLDCLLSFLSMKGILSGLFNSLQGKTLIWGTGILLLCYVCMDEEWKKILCLTLICTFMPGFSYMYNLVYMIPLLLVAIRQNNSFVILLVLLSFIYYPFDVSFMAWLHVENAVLLPRLWDIIASLSGVTLIGFTLTNAARALVMRIVSSKRIRFHTDENKQIIFNSRIST